MSHCEVPLRAAAVVVSCLSSDGATTGAVAVAPAPTGRGVAPPLALAVASFSTGSVRGRTGLLELVCTSVWGDHTVHECTHTHIERLDHEMVSGRKRHTTWKW